jgi:hypothetical protein
MSETLTSRKSGGVGGVFSRFWGFNSVCAAPVKRVYKTGLALIALVALVTMARSMGLAIETPGGGAEGFFLASAFVGVGTVTWRFACSAAAPLLHPEAR